MNRAAGMSEPDFSTDRLELVETPAKTASGAERPSVAATVLHFEHGLYVVEIGEIIGPRGRFSGLEMPLIQVAAAPDARK